ncbi:hypothetical protein SAMN05216226_102187 [Halovenus aranensis]|uniref:Uncharacterized protein n=1 Tax=Halovenus aranensis TaxID=890420 RepID=A0A1G8SY84_9EURY|nr:hypothetical protein [Halovenus aranensis]SDJ33705.1 hypothetical protein SAMN05216226_102187 [Halovenus aranensis]
MDSQAEVTGRYIVSMAESAGEVSPVFERKIRELLEEHGIKDPEADGWYSAEHFVEAVNRASEDIGSKTILEAGTQMGRDVPQPEEVDGPKDALAIADEAQQAAYRNASEERPAGGYKYEETGENSVRMGVTSKFPYPEEIAKGSIKGIVESTTSGSAAAVVISEVNANPDEMCAYEIEW